MASRRPEPDGGAQTAAGVVEAAAGGAAAAAVRFAAELRAAGLHANLDAAIGFVRALTLVDLADSSDVRDAGAAFFVDRPEDRPRFDDAFDRFWLRDRRRLPLPERAQSAEPEHDATRPPPGGHQESPVADRPMATDDTMRDAGADADVGETEPRASETYSGVERLRAKAFEDMSADELVDAGRLIDELRPHIPRRLTRRYRLHPRGRVPAPRAMLRRSLAVGGEVDWSWRRRRTRPRAIVAVCDISGSMEQHARFALRFVHALTRLDVRTESFVFGTRLTRITPHLRRRETDAALRAIAASVADWSGGTQLGRALHDFNRQWARRVLKSSAIVLIVSDGWDRGDPRLVADEIALLHRRCYRLVWLNPLAATAGYQPRTAGMAAAYPFVDDFVGFRSVDSLARLGELLALGTER